MLRRFGQLPTTKVVGFLSWGIMNVCKLPLIGAIAGDIIGSTRERKPEKNYGLELFKEGSTFTDDTVMLLAVAEASMNGRDYATSLRTLCRKYRDAGYGAMFGSWVDSVAAGPYESWGNGSAVRATPIGWIYSGRKDLTKEARRSAEVTHNHVEGIKGADAAVHAVCLLRRVNDKVVFRKFMELSYGYDFSLTDDEIRPDNKFDVSCQVTVPHAFICFLCSTSFEDCLRRAVSLGGDADSLGCLAGAVAQAYYGEVPQHIAEPAYDMLPADLRDILVAFSGWLGL